MFTLLTIIMVSVAGAMFMWNPLIAALVFGAAVFVAKQGGPNDTDNLAGILFAVLIFGAVLVLVI